MFVCMVFYILIYFFVNFLYLTMPTGYLIFLIMYISIYVCMHAVNKVLLLTHISSAD